MSSCVKRVCGGLAILRLRRKRVNRGCVESRRMCLFVEGDQHHNKYPHQFRPITSKNNTTALQRFPQFLKAGTVYEWGLRIGVKICLKCMYDCIAFKGKTVCKWFWFLANVGQCCKHIFFCALVLMKGQ